MPTTSAEHWLMYQKWKDLFFLNWKVDPILLYPHIPQNLKLDNFNGDCWLTMISLVMEKVQLHALPSLFSIGPFPELNIRTYVKHGQKRGIFFLDILTSHYLSTIIPRIWYRLPYNYSRISNEYNYPKHHISISRKTLNENIQEFDLDFQLTESSIDLSIGSLEHWLVDRNTAYTVDSSSRLYLTEVEHPLLRLHKVDYNILKNTFLINHQLDLNRQEPYCFFSQGVDVNVKNVKKIYVEERQC